MEHFELKEFFSYQLQIFNLQSILGGIFSL